MSLQISLRGKSSPFVLRDGDKGGNQNQNSKPPGGASAKGSLKNKRKGSL